MSIVKTRIKITVVTTIIVHRTPSKREPSGVKTKNKITIVTTIIVHRTPIKMEPSGIICYN